MLTDFRKNTIKTGIWHPKTKILYSFLAPDRNPDQHKLTSGILCLGARGSNLSWSAERSGITNKADEIGYNVFLL
jgi:hypothetical protein